MGLKQGPYLKVREVPSLPETKQNLGELVDGNPDEI
jgi:hypothetical protein